MKKIKILDNSFFSQDAEKVAIHLLGKVIRHKIGDYWLSAMIIETEAYYVSEKGSHASLGRTPKRDALFKDPGTIYMYYARGGDSFNISCLGEGNAVLLKSGYAYFDEHSPPSNAEFMQKLNPVRGSGRLREIERLCSGQTLLCYSLGLRVNEWDGGQFCSDKLYVEDVNIRPSSYVQTIRLGIPSGRDEHLPLRYIYSDYARFATKNPLTQRKNKNYRIKPLSTSI